MFDKNTDEALMRELETLGMRRVIRYYRFRHPQDIVINRDIKELTAEMRREALGHNVRGAVTVILVKKGAKGPIGDVGESAGFSLCSRKDPFDKYEGRMIATARAIKILRHDWGKSVVKELLDCVVPALRKAEEDSLLCPLCGHVNWLSPSTEEVCMRLVKGHDCKPSEGTPKNDDDGSYDCTKCKHSRMLGGRQ